MSEVDIKAIELNIKDAEELVNLGKSLERLMNNRDFKKVIKEGYLDHEAVRLVHLKANPACQNPQVQENILREIDGIGSLLGYFRKLQAQAEHARQAIEEGEAELDMIRGEEGEA